MQNVDIISKTAILYLPIDSISPNPYQPRRSSDGKSLKSLIRSIKQYGIIEPVNVRLINGGTYELVSGERRLRAGRAAGLTEIPAVVVDINDRDTAIIALVENMQRDSLDFFDVAEALRVIMEDFNCNAQEIAAMLCVPYEIVKNKLRLLTIGREIRSGIIKNRLSQEYAIALAYAEKEDIQREVLKKIVEQGLDIKAAYAAIDSLKGDVPKLRVKKCFKDIRLFINTIKQAAALMTESGMTASYTVRHNDNEYEIRIIVRE